MQTLSNNSAMIEIEPISEPYTKIKVIGVGGGGNNAINSMALSNIYGVELIAVNTDKQALERSKAHLKVQIGENITKGLGAGADPNIGRQAALDDKEILMSCLEGSDMVFITAGMGGGTGTGAAPVIASISKELGILTVSIVTKPFRYEGRRRTINAEEGIKELKKYSDTFILIPNDKIRQIVPKDTPLIKAFEIADDVLRQSIQGISDIILIPGHINVDFADVKSVMTNSGRAVIGLGIATGENSAVEAARKAISNQLLEDTSIQEAKGILLNITGGLDFSIDAFDEASSLIANSAHEDANIILGHVINPDLVDEVRVTVIATGIDNMSVPIDIPGVKPIRIPYERERKPSTTFFNSSRVINKTLSERQPEENSNIDFSNSQATSHVKKSADKDSNDVNIAQPSIIQDDDIYDIPTFLRRKKG